MNEAEPKRPRWWGRPRAEGSAGQHGVSGTGASEGLGETAVPGEGQEAETDAVPLDEHDGDFELARPAGTGGAGDDGDYELSRPASAAGHVGTADSVGPSAEGPSAVDEAGSGCPSGAADSDSGRPSVAAACADVPGGTDSVGRSADVPPAVPPSASSAADRPKPLHDPDPYSTPPYGEPGPWAPAPPVQHPVTAHAQGTPSPVPVPPSAQDMPAPADASPAAGLGPGSHGEGPVLGPRGTAPVPGGSSTPAPPYADATPAPAADPWQRYDPWAAHAAPSGPLQQNGVAVPSAAQKRKRVRKALVGGGVALALVSGVCGGFVGAYLERNGGVGAVELPQASAEPTGRPADSVAGIAARALPSVVTLHVSGSAESGTGTGFVLDNQGHILTNNHVVEPAGDGGQISVVFNGGETAVAEVVGRDSGYDLAVVKVSGVKGLTPLPLGNSDNVQVGDPVVAIGAPFDLEGTVTSGIISAKERPITAGGGSGDGSDVSYVDALQTDAPINPGNSGGPLLDSQGRVIGINSAIQSADDGSVPDSAQSGSIGLGFAIPVNQGKRVAEELINTGKATHPVIGITLDMDYTGDGARVGTRTAEGGAPVTEGGPGDRAGIRPGDVITEVDGQRIHSGEELIVKTRAQRPGDRLELTVERDGEERTLSLVLGSSDGT